MDKETLLAKVHDARTIGTCLQWMEPLFQKQDKTILESLKSLFRRGDYSEQVLACHIAQMCAIEDLRNLMRSITNAGDEASKIIERQEEE